MQKRTSPLKFGDLAEKSGLNSVSNLSTKAPHDDETPTFVYAQANDASNKKASVAF